MHENPAQLHMEAYTMQHKLYEQLDPIQQPAFLNVMYTDLSKWDYIEIPNDKPLSRLLQYIAYTFDEYYPPSEFPPFLNKEYFHIYRDHVDDLPQDKQAFIDYASKVQDTASDFVDMYNALIDAPNIRDNNNMQQRVRRLKTAIRKSAGANIVSIRQLNQYVQLLIDDGYLDRNHPENLFNWTNPEILLMVNLNKKRIFNTIPEIDFFNSLAGWQPTDENADIDSENIDEME